MGKSVRPLRDGEDWTREEAILAFDLYCRIPFKRTKSNNPEVIALAQILQRTPASVARKLGNFGAFDPNLAKQDITGLTHTSKLDKAIWQEFNSNWSDRVIEADRIRSARAVKSCSTAWKQIDYEYLGPTEREIKSKQRIYQDFFRASVLSGYNQRCCICGIPHPEILTACHIVPWSIREDTRVNPENGLCLCASHDRAFDRELIAIAPDYSVILCKRVKKSDDAASKFLFSGIEGKRITLPDRFAPRRDFLNWRLDEFLKSESALDHTL
ncbi:MAG TPA: HNH endonuclease [Verrucomicrobiae bacterium]|jgi:putative restriction endonuclease